MAIHIIQFTYPTEQKEHEASLKGPKYAEVLGQIEYFIEKGDQWIEKEELVRFINEMKTSKGL